jgi:hypothetical protein
VRACHESTQSYIILTQFGSLLVGNGACRKSIFLDSCCPIIFLLSTRSSHNFNSSELVKVFLLMSMFSFKSFVFTMLLVPSTEGGSTSLRSSMPDWSRRLSLQTIAGYAPQTLVTDHVSHNLCLVCVELLALSPAR